MKFIQKYALTFLLMLSIFTSTQTQSMDQIVTQIKSVITTNLYVSSSILAGMVAGSYIFFKKYLLNSTPIKLNHDNKETQKVITAAQADTANQPVAQNSPVDQVSQDENKGSKIITVINNQAQALDINISNNDSDYIQQFSIPNYSCRKININ